MNIEQYIAVTNIADSLDEKVLNEIGSAVCEGYDFDNESCSDWRESNKEALELARQVKDGRTYAGETVSDVKYPIIASAAIQYAARAYPAIVRNEEVVKSRIIGKDDENGTKAARGERITSHMNYQIMERMDGWEDDMDRLLVRHAIIGDYFKKTYYDPIKRKNCSELVSPEDLVVFYNAPSFEKTQRKTHRLEYSHNEYIEKVRAGMFSDIEIERPERKDEDQTHTFLEQHCFWDLDEDDYEEPYVITVHEETQKVVRITARFTEDGIEKNDDGEILRIEPIEYFTQYPFMPSFDGGVYGMGFGILLSPINHSINTIINQLMDAGKLANRQGGFLGNGVRLLRGGESGPIRFKAGEWKRVKSIGDDLRKGIVPLPTAQPSAVLFQLLGLLMDASRELASQSELLSGQQAQHNVPATTTLALIEQGLKVFSAVYKRVYRGLKKEFKKLFALNAAYMDEKVYQIILDDPSATRSDYSLNDFDIVPVSSNATVSDTQKYVKAQAVMELSGRNLNDKEIYKYYLESLEIPNVTRFVETPNEPHPKLLLDQAELELKQREVALKERRLSLDARETLEKMIKLRAEAVKFIAEAEEKELGPQMEFYKSQIGSLSSIITNMDNKIQEITNAGIDTNGGGMGGAQGVPPGPQAAQATIRDQGPIQRGGQPRGLPQRGVGG